MPRYIDADALTVAVYDAYDDIPEIHDRGILISEKFRRLIYAQKTIDAVPVVRCKDCKWYTPHDNAGTGYCYMAEWYTRYQYDDDYCSRGERKDD